MQKTALILACWLLTASAEAGSYAGSFYQAVAGQTDGSPHRSACGPTRAPWTQVAVTRNLLRRYGCGTAVRVALASLDGRFHKRFNAVVWDVMPGEGNRVDVLVSPQEPALSYGKVRVTLTRR